MRYCTLKIIHDTLTAAVETANQSSKVAWERFAVRADELELTSAESYRHPETKVLYEEYNKVRENLRSLENALSDFNNQEW